MLFSLGLMGRMRDLPALLLLQLLVIVVAVYCFCVLCFGSCREREKEREGGSERAALLLIAFDAAFVRCSRYIC